MCKELINEEDLRTHKAHSELCSGCINELRKDWQNDLVQEERDEQYKESIMGPQDDEPMEE
jgi:hypothetical protein